MPIVKGLPQAHRHKLGFHEYTYAVARPVMIAEIRTNPVRLPRNRWPKSWVGKYKDPVRAGCFGRSIAPLGLE